MADVRFYHLQSQPLQQALPDLLAKALGQGHRLIIKVGDEASVQPLSQHLWVCRRDDIFPHGTPQDGDAEYHPIWLTAGNENPNGAKTLILVDGANAPDIAGYNLVCEMLDGHNAAQVDAARARYRSYKDAGHNVTYWQQKPAGGWEQKA
jgi:DNA polymerase-3 subunit chi